MNWADGVVILIIGLFAVMGLINGFVYSAFKIASFVVSLILALKFYPVLSGLFMQTNIYNSIKNGIFGKLSLKGAVDTVSSQAEQTAQGVVNSLTLPDFLKESLFDGNFSLEGIIDTGKILETISGGITRLIIDILSFILLYIAIRLLLLLFKSILKELAKLPVFKQIDKAGGFLLGAAEGLLTIYIAAALLMLFNTSPLFAGFFEQIDGSNIAKFFYENNFIVNLMFK